MQLARIIGRATSTVKHPSLHGWKLLVLQPLRKDGGPDGEPQLAVDSLGSALNSVVIAAADGSAAREIMNVKTTPVRWVVIGQPDAQTF